MEKLNIPNSFEVEPLLWDKRNEKGKDTICYPCDHFRFQFLCSVFLREVDPSGSISKKFEELIVADPDRDMLATIKELTAGIEIKDIGNVLDAGCGSGLPARIMNLLGAHVFGCDSADKSLELAVRNQIQDGTDIQYALADITKLPYADASMNHVTCISVPPYMPDPGKFFEEARRVLPVGGTFSLSFLHPNLIINPPKGMPWMRYVAERYPIQENDRLTQEYTNRFGQVSVATNYYHSVEFYLQALVAAGFRIKWTQEPVISEQIIGLSSGWGTDSDYPAMFWVSAEAI